MVKGEVGPRGRIIECVFCVGYVLFQIFIVSRRKGGE